LVFTTTRVAEEADISVGSLYQYFPNKHALVVAIHRDAVNRGWEHVRSILDDADQPARQKVVDIAKWFFATESSEAVELGAVFEDIEVFLRDRTDEPLDDEVRTGFARFVASASRRGPAASAQFNSQLLMTTLEAVGKAVAAQPLSAAQREQWAVATATMLCDHLGIGRRCALRRAIPRRTAG
jgi:AcrR family transcriptional regulator